MQQMACSHILLLCCVMWPIHPTPICPRLPLRYEATGIHITIFATRCSTSTHVKQIPESILLLVQLLLFCLSSWDTDNRSYVSMRCCLLRISEYMFGDICRHLHAVLAYEASFKPLSSQPRTDLAQPCYDQGQWFHPDKSIINHVSGVHGTFNFYHKSFYDFICDPTRFCVNAPAFYCRFLELSKGATRDRFRDFFNSWDHS